MREPTSCRSCTPFLQCIFPGDQVNVEHKKGLVSLTYLTHIAALSMGCTTEAVAASKAGEVKAAVVPEGSSREAGPVETGLLPLITLVGTPAWVTVALLSAPVLCVKC